MEVLGVNDVSIISKFYKVSEMEIRTRIRELQALHCLVRYDFKQALLTEYSSKDLPKVTMCSFHEWVTSKEDKRFSVAETKKE
jgi:hypothetical protein